MTRTDHSHFLATVVSGQIACCQHSTIDGLPDFWSLGFEEACSTCKLVQRERERDS